MKDSLIESAFNATRPYRGNERIRVTERAADIAAIFSPRVAGVVFRHGQGPEIEHALELLQGSGQLLHMPASTRLGNEHRALLNGTMRPILNQAMRLIQTFKQALDREALEQRIVNQTQRMADIGYYAPHVDSNTDMPDIADIPPEIRDSLPPDFETVLATPQPDIRLAATFTLDPRLTTELYPGNYTHQQVQKFQDVYKNHPDPEAFKDSLGRRNLGLGEALIVKGRFPARRTMRPKEECALHGIPAQPGGIVRVTTIATFFRS